MMASETGKHRSAWDVFQAVMTFATPILVVVLGIVLNRNINQIEARIANVEAMSKYFEMISGTDVAQAKMAAYALYMLNQDDPAMAVSVLLAGASGEGGSGTHTKQYLMDVLKDLATRDEKFRQSLGKVVETTGGKEVDTAAQARAWEVIASVKTSDAEGTAAQEQWGYVGTFRSNRWSDQSLKIDANEQLKEGESYELVKDIRLRAGYPQKPDYRLAKPVGVAHKGDMVKIEGIQHAGSGIWAKVSTGE